MPYDIIVGRGEGDKKLFGKRGLIFIGKTYVTMGNYTSLSNPIYMDVARSHVVLIAGKRGCLTGETKVFTDKGYKSIKDFNPKEDKALSFNKETKEYEWENAELLEYPVKDEELFELEFNDGRKIKLTREHPLLVSYGKYIFWRRACDLKINDKIISPTRIPEIKKDTESLRIARLLGFIMSDGTINIRKGQFKDGGGYLYNGTKARIRIFNNSEGVLVQAKKDFEEEFGIVAKRYERNDCNCEIIETKQQKVVNKFVSLGIPVGSKSGIIRVPEVVFKSSNDFKANFINALFSCDGYIPKTGRYLDYASKSKEFLLDLQLILSHFNIQSVIRIKNSKLNGKIYPNYRLFITDNVSVNNFRKIGFFDEFKQERLNCAKKENLQRKNKTCYYSEDLVCLKIKSISKLNGISKVYDLSVNKNHSFIANGIISHNSGKSYTLGGMAEAISTLDYEEAQNISSLIFDTMGIFWTMKFKNHKDKALLDEWGLEEKNIPVKIYVPFGYFNEFHDKGIPVDSEFAIKISDLEADDWVSLFQMKFTDAESVLIESVIFELKKKENYGFEEIRKLISKAENVSQDVKNSTSALFDAAESWKVFDEKSGTAIRDLVKGGQTTVIDLSMYASSGSFNVRALIIGLVSKRLFKERMSERRNEEIQAVQRSYNTLSFTLKREMPLVWIFIDECITGDTEILCSDKKRKLKEIVENFGLDKKCNVKAFDSASGFFNEYSVNKVFKKGKRKIIKLITETGREIKCTPEHRVLTDKGFASAFSVSNIAFPLIRDYSKDKKIVEARLLGHIYGDGWITDKAKSIGFSGKGNSGDLEKIRSDLAILGFKSANVFTRKTFSKINNGSKILDVEGSSQSFASTSAYKFFREKAGFAGEKVLSSIFVPKQIMQGSFEEKAEFLSSLMGSDGQKLTSAKNAKGDFNAIRFSFNKEESLEKSAFDYAEQLKFLFEELGVKISKISKKLGNIRKDGKKTIKIVLTLEKNVENTLRFLENIGYRYCSEKENSCLKWIEYLKARLFLKNQRQIFRDKIFDLKLKGKTQKEIVKETGYDRKLIKALLTSKVAWLPKSSENFDMWINNRLQGEILFENVAKIEEAGEEEVYDLEVDKVHNFISNGFITHNCHEFLPKEDKTPATEALIQLLREGRQPGISLVMATQQPGKIHTDAMTQSDIVISHRVTAEQDINSLNQIMQTYLYEGIKEKMNGLPHLKGSAILLDDNSERIYPIRVRPRFTWHGGEAPTAVRAEKIE